MGEVIMQTELESEEQGGELGAAALDQVYAEQDEGIGPAAAALTAIVPARKGVTLGEVIAAHPAFEPLAERAALAVHEVTVRAAEAIGGAALNVLEHAGQQMLNTLHANTSYSLDVARGIGQQPLIEFPQLTLGDSAMESLRRASCASMGEISQSVKAALGASMVIGPTMKEIAESMTLASGITDGISAWRETLAIMKGAISFSDVTGSFNSISSINKWQDSLASIKLPSSDLPSIMSGISAWQENSLNEQLSLFSAAQRQREETYTQLLGEAAQRWAAEQQQAQNAMLAAFADIGRWQGQSIQWPEIIPRRWQVYEPEPEPPAEQIEVVQIDDEITLESVSAALAEGRLPWREVMQLAMQHMPNAKPGRKEPPIPEQLALVEGWYAIRGSKRYRRGIKGLDMLQQGYCDKVHISRSTLNRYERTCKALGLI